MQEILDKPQFTLPIIEKINRYSDGEVCTLMSLDDSQIISDEDILEIASICSEDLVYTTLFKELSAFSSGYTEHHAQRFVTKAREGWNNNSTFIFLVRDSEHKIIAALDIKKNDLDAGEVGYWATAKKPGVMTASVLKLIEIARKAGYRKLFALVKFTNYRSASVVTRAGFKLLENVEHDHQDTHNRFEIVL